jgi:hypothetical protein
MRLKEDTKKLFDKLKKYGCGFNHINYEKSRKLKINSILEDGFVARTKSPCLKNDTYLEIELYYDCLYLYKLTHERELIYKIENWQLYKDRVFNRITFEYDKYLYDQEELYEIFKDRVDFSDLKSIIDSIYPELRIRQFENHTDKLILYAGSGVFSFQIEKHLNKKKVSVKALFYGSGSYKYQSGNKWNLSSKYRNIIKDNIYVQEIYGLNLNKYRRIYSKCKKVR